MPSIVSRSLRANLGTPPLVFDWSLDFFEREQTALACAYWQSLRKNELLPARSDLVPSEMRKFMAHVGLIEFQERGCGVEYSIRLAGSQWEAVFGSMKGRTLREFLPPDIEARWRDAFEPVRIQARPARVTTQIAFASKRWLDSEMFIAPLSDDGLNVSMLLMCFASWKRNSGRTAI
jgi:hypothetical protein